ncbi:hypothetical protein CRM22_009128 [Opisthorchis felineus]|uniref:Uncharacterized protein n=1 Tax=Opisthorchis felineus TaxID=147828 RepID=A0A4S2L8U0_OPIFE|nr:hypothetical protein CRM22_009128 [Opisthorchis felineus]
MIRKRSAQTMAANQAERSPALYANTSCTRQHHSPHISRTSFPTKQRTVKRRLLVQSPNRSDIKIHSRKNFDDGLSAQLGQPVFTCSSVSSVATSAATPINRAVCPCGDFLELVLLSR